MISIGYIVGTGVMLLLVAAAVVGARACYRYRAQEVKRGGSFNEATEAGWFARGCLAAGCIPVLVWLFAAWPVWDMAYHRYDTVTGTVATVDKRLVSEGEGMSEKYVVQLAGDSQQYGCLDTRCALIQPGEPVELSCIRVWAWYGSDGYDCEYVSAGGRT